MIHRILFYMLAGTLLFYACQGKGKRITREEALREANLTRVELEEKVFDLGDIRPGEVAGHTFRVKNTGEKDLFLLDIETSCGCTTTSYTRGPIKPGKQGTVEVKFDSSGRFGKQYKVVQVFVNTREKIFELTIKANIINP
ncbi:MAG: DUF1573 domain-containing protein [Odoribacteraceae bacterium]|nr:DUF1573 domain-containing protein [Odoribacteraceae bacterium]